MEAITILGVVASASQLVAYGGSILIFLAELFERVQNVPVYHYEYELQLKLLVSTSRAIEQNPDLQSPDVKTHLDATVTEVRSLQYILCAPGSELLSVSGTKKCWRLITGKEHRKILAHLENLHRKNTRLLLCLSTMNATQLSFLQNNMEKLLEFATALQNQQLVSGGPDESQKRQIENIFSETFRNHPDSKALVRAPERMPATPDVPVEKSKTGKRAVINRFGNTSITGSKSAEVQFGNTSQSSAKADFDIDDIFLANEFQDISITSETLIYQQGDVGLSPAGNDYGGFRFHAKFVKGKMGNFDSMEEKKQWHEEVVKEIEQSKGVAAVQS